MAGQWESVGGWLFAVLMVLVLLRYTTGTANTNVVQPTYAIILSYDVDKLGLTSYLVQLVSYQVPPGTTVYVQVGLIHFSGTMHIGLALVLQLAMLVSSTSVLP